MKHYLIVFKDEHLFGYPNNQIHIYVVTKLLCAVYYFFLFISFGFQ